MPVFPVPRALTLGAALALMAPVVPSHADPIHLPAISVEGANADDPRVPEVTTATRTQTAARYVPQAIDTVKVENLQNYGIRTLGEALSGIPNVSNASDARFDSLRIRGFDASNDFYLDGIRDDSQYVRDLHNIERIDVLKGPAAVLYGRGSQGGIVNRISKAPQPGRESTLEAQAGSWDLRSFYGDLSADPGEHVSVRLNIGQEDSNSFRHKIGGTRQLVAPSLNWRITPDLDWLVQYEYSRYDRTPDRGIPSVNGRPADVGRSTVYGDPDRDYIDDRAQSFRSRLAYTLAPGWQLRYTLGVFALDSKFDNTYLTGYNAATGKVSRTRWQQDLTTRSISNNLEAEGLFHTGVIEHRVLFGVDVANQARTPDLYTTLARGPGAQPVPTLDLYDPDLSQQHNGAMTLSSSARHKTRSQGYYVQDQIKLDDAWQVLLGLRMDRFSVDSTNRMLDLSARRDSRGLSPRAGVVWTPARDHSFYASYSKTFSPVGGSLIGITPNARGNTNDVDPEQTRQYEVGVKSDWLDGNLSTTLALYQLELYNRRTSDPVDPTIVLLTGKQRSRGIELTAAGRLTGNWYLRGGIGLQNASIVEDNNGLAGNRVSNVARRNGSVFLTYKPAEGLYGETGLTFVGQRYADNANTAVLPGYATWDALVGYRAGQWDWRLAVRNITDKTYYASATSAGQIRVGEPRTVVATAQYRF
ncbi:TonB-dependent receptor [Achromobacter dolens]|uniref:TonB-dependent receptor n=2 Tax=Achromobacter dolens TaxID=1287738 RepID=UPI003B9964B9